MCNNSNQLELKRILVDLEDEHQHLIASVNHLEQEIEKREIEIRKLLADRELELTRGTSNLNFRPKRARLDSLDQQPKSQNLYEQNQQHHSKQDKTPQKIQYNSEFTEQVDVLLENLNKTLEQISASIKLMNIRYTRLSTGESITNLNFLKWIKSQLPLAFLRQQMLLFSLVIGSLMLFIFTRFLPDIEFVDILSELKYGVIVDCGSSGSRAHIFKWKNDPIINQIELARNDLSGKPLGLHITPGLSTFKDDPAKASDYMEPIMNYLSESIPFEKHFDTPIYFMATAGLRLLEVTTQRKILSDITRDLRAKYDFPRLKSQVISGEFEGVYSWLSLNINKKLYNNSQSSKSYGVIEMGGASTQVTFELNPETENAILKDLKSTDALSAFKKAQITINLSPGNSVKLFATTFLGLGVNSARDAAIDLLARDHLNETVLKKKDLSEFEVRLEDPCLTVGSSEIVFRPTALLQARAAATHQSIGFVIKEREETFRASLEGTGNFDACMNLLERIMLVAKNEKLNCPSSKEPCSMALLGSDFIPYAHYPFVGLSEMFFTTNEMLDSAGPFNRTEILDKVQKVCGTEYQKLREMHYKNITHEDRILYECFKASWLLTILHNSGFKMPASYTDFATLDKLDGREIDWTLGAMIKEVALDRHN